MGAFSGALLVLSAAACFLALGSFSFGVGAAGFWGPSIALLCAGVVEGGVGGLLLLASHACRRWRDARRRTGLMLVCAGAVLLPTPVMLGLILFDPALVALLAHGNANVARMVAAVSLWRVALAEMVPAVAIASGVGLVRTASGGTPLLGFSSAADGS